MWRSRGGLASSRARESTRRSPSTQPREGIDLAGKTLGIIGLGAIGKEVAQRANAFKMRILAHDPVQDLSFAKGQGVAYVSLEDLLRQSDFVSLHCFLNDVTRYLINVSPHVGGATADARRLSGAMAAENLIRALRGERPRGLVNPEVLAR